MEIKANYHSVIAIGGFNPAILTPDFLREYCSFQSDHEPTGLTTPVTTKLKYGNIEFVMELNRFQIKLEEIEKEIILNALRTCGGNVSEAARKLHIGRDALRYRIKKYSILKMINITG